MTFSKRMVASVCAVAALAVAPYAAAADTEIEKLREEFEQKLKVLQQDYESRLKELEERLKEPAPAAPAAAAPATRESGITSGRGNFNPDISLVLQGQYLRSKDIAERHITGFIPGADEDGSGRGFSLGHTELVVSAAVDPYFRGFMTLALAPEGGAEVEEAWFQTSGLGRGLSLKGGRFFSGIGYINEQHPHAWDFADQNLMYQALFGEHLIQDGVQLKWLAPTETFLEVGLEAGRGQFFPGSDEGGNRNGAGAWAAFAKVGGDVGTSHSWRAGLNYFVARPRARQAQLEDVSGVEGLTDFTGDSKTWIADFVWKWAPQGNPTHRNLKLQAEYFRRNEDGMLACADNTAEGGACTGLVDAYRARQSGWYLQGVYQFMPRWRAGYRYDRLDPGNVGFGLNPLATGNYRPTRHTLMADYSFSEFSRFRLQLARDRSMQGVTDNQVTLQYIHSLGAHGAHRF
jgi:hypothetical protein